jgi:2-polyprenyl-6-methoxyphenol hydroxylase-like FAD-dependent oxidoreductase
VVRRHLHPHESPPRASGFLELRGLTPNVPASLDDIDAVVYFGPRLLGVIARVHGGGLFWFLSLPRTVSEHREARDILRAGTTGFDQLFLQVAEGTDDADLRVDDAIDRDPLGAWGTGRITLLGDAAHPMLPHAGQGAAQAIEDSVALGLTLGADAIVEQALRRYESIRMPRTRAVVERGRRTARFQNFTNSAWWQWGRNTAIRWTPPQAMLLAALLPQRGDPHRLLRR